MLGTGYSTVGAYVNSKPRTILVNKKRKYMRDISRLLSNKINRYNGLTSADIRTIDQSVTACKRAVNEIDERLGMIHTYNDV